MHILAN